MKMFLDKIHSEGLSHLSYIVGHGGRAAVVDPRRDCDIYIEIASRNGVVISHIFETHRNEDYVIGSTELALKTGADIYHGKAFDFDYGKPVSAGDTFEIGDLTLTVIETPGHTYESISISVADRGFGDSPIAVFSGDALFSGDVGRTDFFPDKAEEVAGLLYDSIFDNLLPLGDHVILLPAHGAGSVFLGRVGRQTPGKHRQTDLLEAGNIAHRAVRHNCGNPDIFKHPGNKVTNDRRAGPATVGNNEHISGLENIHCQVGG